MSGGVKLPVRVVYPAAERLVETLAPACERIEIAGSLRRATVHGVTPIIPGGDQVVGDIEIVAISKPARLRFGERPARNAIEERLRDMADLGLIERNHPYAKPAWGERYKKFWIAVGDYRVQVDLFLATADNWGAQVAIRTGPSEFSKALVTHIRYNTPYVQQDGYLRVQVTGEIVPVPEEADYFERAGVQWVEPPARREPDDVVPIRRWTDVEQGGPTDGGSPRQLGMF